jgi:hypothetical protein
MALFSLPNAHVISKFVLDGKSYEIDYFKIYFSQDIDFKGQPENEVRGGILKINLSQIADNNLYMWAKKSTQLKGGEVLFQTDLGVTVLRINFENAYCIELTRQINSMKGASSTLVISPEKISINGKEHTNYWKGRKS